MGGCISIPEHHSTLGKYNELLDTNTECFPKDTIVQFSTPVTPQLADELNSLHFTILNWNIYKGSKRGWQDDFQRLSNQSDIVVLQEGYLAGDLQDLLNKQHYNWDIAKAFTYNDIYTGVLTASTIKPDFLCSFREPEPLSGIPKTVLITRYPLSGTDVSLLVANIHMINFSLDIKAYRAQLEKIVEVVSLHQGPMVIAGDFNSWNTQRLEILANIALELGVSAVAFETDHRVLFMGKKVDHIFYRQLVPVSALSEKVTTSDHNPMLVTFRLADNV